MTTERIVSGSKPTGDLHIGNYFGAIQNWVNLQDTYECFYFIANYHALTEEWDAAELEAHTAQMVLDLLACGVDPSRSVLFVQSDVPEHTELAWILSCLTSFGDLARMTQFKQHRETAAEGKEFISAGLFEYPVLQAADILVYHGTKVPVGGDQLQHLELCRRIARRFNQSFGPYFPEPEPILTEAPRIMSMPDPTRKMSKSLGDDHVIGLMEPEESIWQKIRTAVTDLGPASSDMSPGVANLFLLLKLANAANMYDQLKLQYQEGTLKYLALKKAVFEHLLAFLRPIRQKRERLTEEDAQAVLKGGAEKARPVAQKTLQDVKARIGLAFR